MRVRSLACALASTLLAAAPLAQTPPPAGSGTVGFMHAIHATNVVEKTLAFYTEVFGLSGQVQPFANEAVPILTDSPGVSLKVSMLRLPGEGFNFELTEFSNVTRTPAQPQIWDPGAPHMKILVRDLEPVVAAVRKLGAPILTTSRAPVAVSTPIGNVKAIMFRDPDGYIVEAVQAQVGEVGAWARARGLTSNELASLLAERALVDWLRDAGPEAFGLAPDGAVRARIEALLAPAATPLGEAARELAFVAAWARASGVRCPRAARDAHWKLWSVASSAARRELALRARAPAAVVRRVLEDRATAAWVLETGPRGFARSADLELAAVLELQLIDAIADLLPWQRAS